MVARFKNAAHFYTQHFRREARKEIALMRALANGKPIVSYMGWTGFANLGDEILYKAHQELFPHMNVVSYRKSVFDKIYKLISRKDTLYKAAFLGGGTLINQSDSWINQIEQMEALGIPVYCLGTGVTENDFRAAHEKTSLAKWVKVLDRFNYVGIRGPYSQQLLQEAGFKEAEVVGDTALALAPATYDSNRESKVIGINFGLISENNIWGDKDEYTQNIVIIIKKLIKAGYTIHLLPVWDKDLPSNKALLEAVDSPNCLLISRFDSLENYQEELQKCSLFIGQKLHATIMACMLRIPSIMIEYQPKCRDFMASIDMERWVVKTSECKPDYILGLIDALQSHCETIQSTINSHVVSYKDTQIRIASEIENELLG